MAIRVRSRALGRLLCVASMLAVAGSFASAAQAQEPESVIDAIENITERRSGSYFQNRSFMGQASFMTGLGGFSEQRMLRDAAAFSGATEELWILQTQNTATVRVPDLPNPYTTSVQLLPTAQFDSRVVGSELNFEPLPRR